MGVETAIATGLVLSAVGTGVSAVSAIDQRKRAKAAAAKLKSEQDAENAAALKERKSQIDTLRESALGLSSGRRTLLSGSETGQSASGGMISSTLG